METGEIVLAGGCFWGMQKYLSLLYRKDSLHNYIDCASGKVIQGIIRGISPAACLRLEIPGEGIREFAFKEISYVI